MRKPTHYKRASAQAVTSFGTIGVSVVKRKGSYDVLIVARSHDGDNESHMWISLEAAGMLIPLLGNAVTQACFIHTQNQKKGGERSMIKKR